MVELQKTRQRIVETLKRAGGGTVGQVAEELGFVAVTVRTHLAILERDGFIFGEERRTGGAGRPHIWYQLTDKGEEIFPRHYDRVANRLLDHLLEIDGPDRVVGILKTIAEDVADEHKDRLATRPFEERIKDTTEILSDQGCTAEYNRSGDSAYRVSIFNCPYRRVMMRHPETCAIELHLLSTLTGAEVEEEMDGSPQGAICSYMLQSKI